MSKKVIIIGNGGHGKVIADIVVKSGNVLLGFLDDNPTSDMVLGFPVLGRVDDSLRYRDSAEFIIAIGDNQVRNRIAKLYGLRWYTAVHPSAQIGLSCKIGEGSAIMANAAVNSSVEVGKHCIVNTTAVVEHDCVLSDYVHVSPGGVLCGSVRVGERTQIGAGAVVRNNVAVCRDVLVGAGGTVIHDITQSGTYVGVPVRWIRE